MHRVVMDRERWFSVVMGETCRPDARTTEQLASRVPFRESAARELGFRLEVLQAAGGEDRGWGYTLAMRQIETAGGPVGGAAVSP